MALTEEIDLTLDAMFLRDVDPNAAPWWVRDNESGRMFKPKIDFSGGLLDEIERNRILDDADHRWTMIAHALSCYVRFFGVTPTAENLLVEIDPYALCMRGSGFLCDCCGESLHILNSRYRGMCDSCDDEFRLSDMELS